MKEVVNLQKKYLAGISLALFVAIVATSLSNVIPVVGASVLALSIGLIINLLIKDKTTIIPGLKFTGSTILKLAIVLLGTSLSLNQILEVGKYSLYVMTFTLIAAFGFGYLFGRILNVNWKMSTLISAGTGICGGSAIAAISPTIQGEEIDVTYSIAATFLFDMLMIILFPIMGRALGLSDLAYGLWTGTAVNDTSSVVAAGYAFSTQAGDFATIVKLTRTLSIIPIVLLFSIVGFYKNRQDWQEQDFNPWKHLRQIAPWFILLFILGAVINSMGLIPPALGTSLNSISKFFMAMALAAIGLNTDIPKLLKAGINPMILGFIVSVIVIIVSLAVQFSLGQL